MSRPPRLLTILTSSATMGVSGKAAGLRFEELATPFTTFVDAGGTVTLAFIRGGPAPIDPRSLRPRGEDKTTVERFLDDASASAMLAATMPLSIIEAEAYDAVFLPGSHGTMWDLPENDASAKLLGTARVAGKVIAAVCHGPAGLVRVLDDAGIPIVRGRRITAFSDSEEQAVGLADRVPFLLETRLRDLGARYERAADFRPFAIADGRLVTGQNPASSALTARLTLDALAETLR